MAAEISARDSSLPGRALPLPLLYIRSPCFALPFPPLAARSRRRIRARAVLLSLRRRRRPSVRRRRRSGRPSDSATPPSASPHRRRLRPRLRFARRPPEHRRPRHPEPRRRLLPLRPPFPSSPSTGVSRRPFRSLPPSLLSLGCHSAAPLVAGGDHRGAGARPPPVGRAGEAAFGAPSRLPSGPGRQPPAPAGAADARDPRRRPPPAACARSTVDRGADAWAPLPVDPVRAPRSLG
uniref:HGWP repeat containing protein-like n=1 Tax=Oryza sativa subsp. japonica TaxID=39947 RepID=Q6F2Z3_ORYSJ|nr:hypothetical protein [Oryza sativa Japonica Group]